MGVLYHFRHLVGTIVTVLKLEFGERQNKILLLFVSQMLGCFSLFDTTSEWQELKRNEIKMIKSSSFMEVFLFFCCWLSLEWIFSRHGCFECATDASWRSSHGAETCHVAFPSTSAEFWRGTEMGSNFCYKNVLSTVTGVRTIQCVPAEAVGGEQSSWGGLRGFFFFLSFFLF